MEERDKVESVTQFLAGLEHPLIEDIEALREIILSSMQGLQETVKWNAPSYSYHGEDRITMRIHPPRQIQLIFHRGAKPLPMPSGKLIDDDSGLLSWKTNDRAVIAFKNKSAMRANKAELSLIIKKWISAAGG